MKRILVVSLISVLLPISSLISQSKVLARVLDADSKDPIGNATVTKDGSDDTTITNAAGYFELTMDIGDVLIVECQGYNDGSIVVPSLNGFKVLLNKKSIFEPHDIDSDYEKGSSLMGYKVGTWEYYDSPDTLSLKIDYDNGSLLYLEPDTSKFVIFRKEKWRSSKLEQHPRYMGSMVEFYKILYNNIKYPKKALKNSTVGEIYATFEIDTSGQASNFEIFNDIGDGCGDEVLRALKLVPNMWTVAKLDGIKYKSRFIMPVSFRMIKDGREVSKTKKRTKSKRPPKAKELEEIVVTVSGLIKRAKPGPLSLRRRN